MQSLVLPVFLCPGAIKIPHENNNIYHLCSYQITVIPWQYDKYQRYLVSITFSSAVQITAVLSIHILICFLCSGNYFGKPVEFSAASETVVCWGQESAIIL